MWSIIFLIITLKHVHPIPLPNNASFKLTDHYKLLNGSIHHILAINKIKEIVIIGSSEHFEKDVILQRRDHKNRISVKLLDISRYAKYFNYYFYFTLLLFPK